MGIEDYTINSKGEIDGILTDNKELVDGGDWGSLVGILNKSFAS